MDRLKPPSSFQETCLQYFWCLSERTAQAHKPEGEQETGIDMTSTNPNNGVERVGKDIGAVFAKEELSDLYPEKSDASYSKVNIPQTPMVPYLFVPPNRPTGTTAAEQNHMWWRQFQTNPPFQFNPARFMFPPAPGGMNASAFPGFQHDVQSSCSQAPPPNNACDGTLVPKPEPDAYHSCPSGSGMELACDNRDPNAYHPAKNLPPPPSQPNHSPATMSEPSEQDSKLCELSPQQPPTPKLNEVEAKWQQQQQQQQHRVNMGCGPLGRDYPAPPKRQRRKVNNSAGGLAPPHPMSHSLLDEDDNQHGGTPDTSASEDDETGFPHNSGTPSDPTTPGSSQGYLLVCNFCGRIFMTRQEFDVHKKSHSTEETLKTRFPEVTFSCKNIHDLFVKRPAEQKPFVCKLCGKACRTEEMCGSHLKCHLGEKPYQCVFCGKRFMHRETCARHEKTHTGEQPYRCELCPRTFVTKEDMQAHLQLHAEGKLFRCEYCGNTFLRKPYLVVHLRTHTGEKPYKCKICGRGFTQRQCCTYHERIHTGEKHYKCHVCGKSYSCHGSFKKHMRRHTGV